MPQFDLNKILCEDCLGKLKVAKAAQRAVRKLKKNPTATPQQKHSWKSVIAKGMRVCPTPAEQMLEDGLISIGYRPATQMQIGPYIVDFFLPPDIVIEVDGSVHNGRKDYDQHRDNWLEKNGKYVFRFGNREVLTDLEKVLDFIVSLDPVKG